jgi:dTMP kinase
MKNLRGKFIVFDGPEGCGKSTQSKLLRDHLEAQGLAVKLYRDPGSSRIGEQIRHILLDPQNHEMGMRCEMLLYMAARAQMMNEYILPALKDGTVVICDRFVSSTLAYQLAGDGLTADQIKKVADIAIHGRWPDLTILLDLPFEKSVQRVVPKYDRSLLPFPQDVKTSIVQEMTHDRIEQRPPEYHKKVRENYLKQAKADPKHYRVIQTDKTAAEVHQEVLRILQTSL